MREKTPTQQEAARLRNQRYALKHPERLQAYRDTHKEESKARNAARYTAKHDEILAKQRLYNETHREQKAETDRAYREANHEKIRLKRQAKYQANREAVLAKHKANYQKNREARLAQNKKWALEHPEQSRQIKSRYRSSHRDTLRAKGRAYQAQRYAANPEQARLTQRQYYASRRAFLSAKARAYLAMHRNVINARQQLKRLLHPEYDRAWRKAHPEASRQKEARRRARKAAVALADLTPAQWDFIQDHYGHRCVYCGRKMKRLTMDHITPLIHGGNHTVHNLVPACRSCNSKKSQNNVLRPIQPLLFASPPRMTKEE